MRNYRHKKLVYHLTSLANLENILECGLLPRSQLDLELVDDVADSEILSSRQRQNLADFVPFHFFPDNPFDRVVQSNTDNKDKSFILITVARTFAKNNGWKVIPRHPLAAPEPSILDYDSGIESIDWDAMNRRDYKDNHSKMVCMAECLSPDPVSHMQFQSIYVPNEETQKNS